MKNICFVCYDLSVMGGSEKVTTDVANALCEYYNVFVVSLFGDKPFFELDKRIHYTNMNIDLSRLRKGIIPVTKRLTSFYKENSIDLSFVVEAYAGLVCSLSSLFSKTKQVYYDHGAIKSQWDRKDIRTIRRINSIFCDYTLVLTEQSKKDYIELFHIKPKRIDYIHNWIDKLPSSVEYAESSSLIMSAGRLALEKQFHSLLPKVAKLVMDRHSDWQWHIYGDGEYLEAIKEQIKALGLEGFLILKGKVSDLEKRYCSYSMYVMTSSREGMPLVLLEAKANGLPIVAFDVTTGPAEIVQDCEDGYLVSYGDLEAMADRICGLIEDTKLRRAMSDKAHKDAARFSKKRILQQWIDYIENH